MDEQAYKQADTEQKLVLLETELTRHTAQLRQIADIVERRATVLNEFGLRIGQQGTRLDQVETSMNRVLLGHNTESREQHDLEKRMGLMLTALIATASMSLGGLGISITTLVVMLQHVTVR